MVCWVPISVLFAGLCAVLVLCLATRWVTGRKRHYVLIPLLLAAGGPAGWFGWQRVQTERAATDVTRELIDDPGAYVVCEGLWASMFSTGMYGGWVDYDQPNRSNLARETCGHLRSYLNSDKTDPSDDEIVAVHVVTHEAAHLQGVEIEQEAECWAVQHNEQTALLFGASPQDAAALANRYANVLYHQMRDGYRDRGCSQDGSMDLTPGDGQWP